ncbi:MAG: 4-alpha-glucanotransferase, partial [Cyanobacteriota bacterium]|nr:4-alpha-glucanotransferase [Cyanobacteriota bacterium]
MLHQRASGLLLHPTSFPSPFGVGDLGAGAYQFIDFLAAGEQRIWQILPLGPTGYGNSPYLCYSALALNPLLISPEELVKDGLLAPERLKSAPAFATERAEFEASREYKETLFQEAYGAFPTQSALHSEFAQFCEGQQSWLEDYALFMALKQYHGGAGWHTWDVALAKREPQALEIWRQQLAPEIDYQKFLQFLAFRQWGTLKDYAAENHIAIMGDIPIYVAHDSADVWANPENFCLNSETGLAALMAGVPPDYFSETGQLWGNPVYDWAALRQDHYAWWLRRFQGLLQLVDIIRIDHFRGFAGYWAVPEGETTAMNGEWLPAPGEGLFTVLKGVMGDVPIVAEDLGVITEDVEKLRDDFGFPGMKVLQFAFDSDRANPFLPFNYLNRRAVVYTGTHDNDTTVGWFEARSPEEQKRVTDYLGCVCPEGIHWSLIRLALGSVANTAIFPLQDILGLGNEARMNLPGSAEGNWGWRYRSEQLTPELAQQLAQVTELYGRRIYFPP